MDVRALLATMVQTLGSVTVRALRRVALVGMLAALLLSGLLAQLGQAGLGMIPTAHAQGITPSAGTPNRFDPHTHATSTPRTTQQPGPGSASTISGGPPVHVQHQQRFSMQPGVLALHTRANAHCNCSGRRVI